MQVLKLSRFHTMRLRDVCRSSGWPFLDTIEIELIAAGLLERVIEVSGRDTVRVTASGVAHMAQSVQQNWRNRSPHEILVYRSSRKKAAPKAAFFY